MSLGHFTLDDFLKSTKQFERLDSMKSVLKWIPGMGQLAKALDAIHAAKTDLHRIKAIIQSMTVAERHGLVIIDPCRISRIANGSGSSVGAVGDVFPSFQLVKAIL